VIKALVVEDDHGFAQQLVERLFGRGIEAAHCSNAAEASALIVKDDFDYVLIDLMLPPSYMEEGIAVLRDVLRVQSHAIPLLMSQRGRGMTSIVDRARDLGARNFFDKNDGLIIENIMARIEGFEVERRSGIFISHGHNELLRYKLKDFVENRLKRKAVVLAEQPSAGMTVVEKLEKVGEGCSFAVILMTRDDELMSGAMRARQNVVHELGFFQGRFGRRNVVLMVEQGVELFTNISGIIYIEFVKDNFESAFESLRTEFDEARARQHWS
jgi:DNA-binding response OmpR family regulator